MESAGDSASKRFVQSLARTLILALIRHIAASGPQAACKRRHVELTVRLRELMEREPFMPHTAEYYAGRLNITADYLNEAVRGATGLSAGAVIRNETLLRAKRLLVYTEKSVRQIADAPGFADSAYFTRRFTKDCGMSPTAFRRQYRE